MRALDLGLAYLAVHNHFGTNRVAFSHVDLDSHARGYPALRQIVGQVVGAVVLTPDAAAGDLWLPDGRRITLAEVVIPSNNLIRLQPQPLRTNQSDPQYDRQARLFGDRGQATFGRLRVAVVGLGGVGSILTELLARLGIGSLVLIDDDVAEVPNLPRLVGASLDDVDTLKTALAARNARRANPRIEVIENSERIETPTARQTLEACDWIFLAADTAAARHYVNATVHQYLIPATQVGVKVPVDEHGEVGQIHAVTRLILPGVGCLWCNGLIDPTELAIDLHPEEERRQARYVAGVEAPSVIALNCLAAAEAADHFMLAVTGLHTDEHDHSSVLHRPRGRERDLVEPSAAGCPACEPRSMPGAHIQQT